MQSNVSYAVPFGVVRVGVDESNEGFDDVWLQQPGAASTKLQRGWQQRPREISDWIHAEGASAATAGVTISSSVGAWDWVDPTGAYPATQPVLAPEVSHDAPHPLQHAPVRPAPPPSDAGAHELEPGALPARGERAAVPGGGAP